MRKVLIYGPPASGKSTLARAIASALGVKSLDLDEEIMRRAGRSVAEIFTSEGEGGFRRREQETLSECLASEANVIALGGGTLLGGGVVGENVGGAVVCIDTPPPDELARRIAKEPGVRPLGDRSRERAAHYASFQHRISSFFEVNGTLVIVGSGIAETFIGGERIVADETVTALHPWLKADVVTTVPSGEIHKTPDTVIRLWHEFARAGIGRRDRIIAVGGGVTGDLTGFAAATWMRGIDWVYCPTTLLAMVDASIGGKTGCDLAEGKNLAGAFHPPKMVVIDIEFLKTLSAAAMRDGRAEMIKHEIIGGVVIGGEGAAATRENVGGDIAANLQVKAKIVREDPFERTGRRLLLNCGHTVGHALEQWSGYTITHGQAVAIGCVEEARLAMRLGVAPTGWPQELAQRFAAAGLSTELPPGVTFDSLAPLMLGDKKHNGKTVTFALPCGWGQVRAMPVDLTKRQPS